jgi:hypothetical protein
MIVRFAALLSVAVMVPSGVAMAADPAPQCPKTLTVVASAAAVPTGFQPYTYTNGRPPTVAGSVARPLPLRSIMFSDGPPSEEAWLAPDKTGKAFQEWRFGPEQENVWMACAYETTTVVVAAKLPKSVTSCRVALATDLTATGLACK